MTASHLLGPDPRFPVGTELSVYAGSYLAFRPGGSALTTATVAADRTATITGLAYLTRYTAGAEVGGSWRAVTFSTEADPGLEYATVARMEVAESRIDAIDACTFGAAALPGIPTDQGAAIQEAIDEAAANVVAGDGPRRVRFSKPGTYTLALRPHPTSPVWAAGIVMKAGVVLDLDGVTLELVDNATLPEGTESGFIVTNDYTPTANSGVQTGRFEIYGGVIDGNGDNQLTNLTPSTQFNGACQAAVYLHRVERPLVFGTKAQNVWGTSGTQPVGSEPGGESFCFMNYRCDGAAYVNCEASGEGITDSATGWNDTYGVGTSHIDCTSHHMAHGMGFSTYKTSQSRYVGCWAHSCTGHTGFNLERADHVVYSACIAGGRLYNPDDPAQVAYGYETPRMALGNDRGWAIGGGYDVTIDSACQSAYNTQWGVFVGVNSALGDDARVSNRVSIYGTHLHSQTSNNRATINVQVDSATITASAFTANTTSGSATLTSVTPGTGTIIGGQEISGTGIPNGTVVDDYDSVAGTIRMSASATATGSAVAVSGVSDVYMLAKAGTFNSQLGNTLMLSEGSGTMVREYINFTSGSASGLRSIAGNSTDGWAFRWYGASALSGPGLGVSANNQAYTGGRVRKRTAVANNYTIVMNDDIVAVTSTASARVLTLPAGATAGALGSCEFEVIDESNAAGTNNITVQRAGSDTFLGGATSKTISTNGAGLRIYWNGTVWVARAITAIV